MNELRSRLINSCIYFAMHTDACGKVKLFKLLYLLDFEHFKETGKSVTGFEYEAWKLGPVPSALMKEWGDFGDDFGESIEIVPKQIIDYKRYEVRVRDGVEFDDGDFSPRQLRILQSIAAKHKKNLSMNMVDLTHEENGAWDKVWNGGEGDGKVIPYELAIPEDSAIRDEVLSVYKERSMYSRSIENLGMG